MNSNSVDLIATDPPFNKGKDFHATPDSLASGAKFQDRWSWEKDVHQEWVDQIKDDHPNVMLTIENARASYGDDMGAFLCFMAVRLLAMRRLLKPTGSIYLHCDPTASHYLKMLMDGIFGKKNFRNEIVWCYLTGGRGKTHFPKKHDLVYWYSKTKNYAFYYRNVCLPRDFSTMHETVQIDEDGRKYQRNVKAGKEYKYYEDEGVLPNDYWTDIQAINPASKERRFGYPTQKPLELYERIIKASSNEGDVVLDPFCGCATTAVAAERLGREWVGIDIWDKAHDTVVKRLTEQVGLFGKVHYTKEVPERTDKREIASAHLQVKERIQETEINPHSHAEMLDILIAEGGMICRGCDREFDHPRYLELDHQLPKSEGGRNAIDNRMLLCTPCNRAKSNTSTLTGLRQENKKKGLMSPLGV